MATAVACICRVPWLHRSPHCVWLLVTWAWRCHEVWRAARRCRRAERRCGISPAYRPGAHPLCGQSRRRPGGVRDRTSGKAASPRTRPAEIGEVRVVRRGAGAGARGRSSASAVPSQRRHSGCRKPPKRRLRPRAASRQTSEVNADQMRCRWWTSRVAFGPELVDFTGGFPGKMVDLAGGFVRTPACGGTSNLASRCAYHGLQRRRPGCAKYVVSNLL